MLNNSYSKNLQDLTELSPWGNEQLNTVNQQKKQRRKMKKMKNIIPKLKPASQRKFTQKKNSIKLVEHVLPPVNNKKFQTLQKYRSMTIQPPVGKLIRNTSSHKLQSTQSMTKLIPDKQYFKMRLSGKKYDMIPQQRSFKSFTEQSRSHNNYLTNNTVLLISRKKQDILRRVLNQIQGRIKQMNIVD